MYWILSEYFVYKEKTQLMRASAGLSDAGIGKKTGSIFRNTVSGIF